MNAASHETKNPSPYAVVIPNWNGALFIERCLGSVQTALRQAGLSGTRVLVHDDASEDDSVAWIRNSFPAVELLIAQENIGFGAAVNHAMNAVSAEWVFLLNNDLALSVDFCSRLIAARDSFPDGTSSLFAIGALTRDWATQEPNHGGQRAVFKRGLLQQDSFTAESLTQADFFQAGACLIHRERFLALGGFSPVFHPGYWEDYDLAWTAHCRGWRVYYEPRAVAYHCGKSSMRKRYGNFQVSLFLRRNHLLFNWLNLDSQKLWRHCLGLPVLIWRDHPAPARCGWGRALLNALVRLPAVLHARRQRNSN